jgi:hypothetical protein
VLRPLVDKDLVIRGSDEQTTSNLVKSQVIRLNLRISWTWRLGVLVDLGEGVWQFDLGVGFLDRVFGTVLLVQYFVFDLDALMNYNGDISVVLWYDCNDMDIPSSSPAPTLAVAPAVAVALTRFNSRSLTRVAVAVAVAVGLRFLDCIDRINCSEPSSFRRRASVQTTTGTCLPPAFTNLPAVFAKSLACLVDGIECSPFANRCACLVDPNDAGRSLLANLLACLVNVDCTECLGFESSERLSFKRSSFESSEKVVVVCRLALVVREVVQVVV